MSHTLKMSEAGEMHSITLGGITSYHIFTKAGFFRGGKTYFADKIFRVLSGEVELIFLQPHLLALGEELGGGQTGGIEHDIHEILTPESGERSIPAGVPHIFKAVTDCVFIESFPENTKSEEYERYRAMKI